LFLHYFFHSIGTVRRCDCNPYAMEKATNM
jgi:hypothetical protein